MQKYLFRSLVLASISTSLSAQTDSNEQPEKLTEVVVTATRTETPINEIGSAISVITAADIAAKHINNVADALRTLPGLDVIRSGGPGQASSVFIRGASSNHTLVLLDGVEANDPSSSEGGFDFAFLQTDNIERIEVLRGAASAVYGSDAIGGVINIITKKGTGKPKFTGMAEGGSYGTWKTGGAISGSKDNINYSLDASRLETTGFPAADKNYGNTTADAYRNTTVSGRTGLKISDALDVGSTLRYNQGKAFLDNGAGPAVNNPWYSNAFQELFTRGFGHLNLFNGFWEQTLGLAYSRTQRNLADNLDFSANGYLGQKMKLDYQSILHLHDSNTLTMGAEEEADSLHASYASFSPGSTVFSTSIPSKTMNTVSYYLQDQIKLFHRSFTTIGARYDDNNRFGGHVTWRANELYDIKETGTRVKGSYGTGFKAPALFQLYDTLFNSGNPNLRPETSINWDIGLEQDLWREKITSGVSYYNNTFQNLIQYVPTGLFAGTVQNVGHATAKGLETFIEVRPITDLSLRGSYTYQDTKDVDTGSQLIRRPRNKASFDADYRFLEKAHVHLNILVVGPKTDVFYNNLTGKSGLTTVTGYTLLNLSTTYDLNKNFQVFGRIDNFLNKQYEETWGYGTSGLAGYGGVKAAF